MATKEFLVKVLIEPKPELLDPQGHAVEIAMHELGLETARETRVGKLVKYKVQAASEEEVRKKAIDISNELLVNPIIEIFSIEVETL
ncbi:phosphoribosylformylglycinamidine synthase subunit PurS [Candidatus Acetothermia bacterium]|nr:phosphoribosylformylglycinamidine synthase subunit PurS [Candidatus Acetothermia bacterium]MBI3460286.1 phosphoribosylformylglycinamidine synthase subunit PurS [Candidatus Acetothermia bacterium]